LLYEEGNPRTSVLLPSLIDPQFPNRSPLYPVFPLRLEDTAKLIPGEDPGKSGNDSPFPLTVVSPFLSRMTIGAVEGGEKRLTLRALRAPSSYYYLRQQSRLFHSYQLPFCLAGFFFGLPKASAFLYSLRRQTQRDKMGGKKD
jgi:hypothetical protein